MAEDQKSETVELTIKVSREVFDWLVSEAQTRKSDEKLTPEMVAADILTGDFVASGDYDDDLPF